VMGPEFQNYEITALTLFRNDHRAQHNEKSQTRRGATMAKSRTGCCRCNCDSFGRCMRKLPRKV
jgi:hypothetical protein